MRGRMRCPGLRRGRPDQDARQHESAARSQQQPRHDMSEVSQCSPIRMPFGPYLCGVGAWKWP